MTETLEESANGKEWHWQNVQKDLVIQGGLGEKELKIDSLVRKHGCSGEYNGNQFHITWLPDVLLLVTCKEYDEKLIDAFSKVVEYKPFVRYQEPDGRITVEWDRIHPNKRYEEILGDGKRDITPLKFNN